VGFTRIVERVLAARGIPRANPETAASATAAQAAVPAVPPSQIAAPVAASSAVGAGLRPAPTPSEAAPAPAPPKPVAPAVQVAEFVSESDVRAALSRGEKIYLGPKTIVTPSARDLGAEHDIFVTTDIIPAKKKSQAAG